jgi:predicted P-loop ATPase
VHHEVGYAIEPEILILDVDVRDGKKGKESLIKLSHDHQFDYMANAEVIVITGSGGYHLYYKKPPEVNIYKNIKEYPHIDFLSKGCFVVIAGSQYHTGTSYQWAKRVPQSIDEATPAPQALLTLLEKQTYEYLPAGEAVEITDDTLAFAAQIAQDAEPAVEGANGDDTTYRVVCRVRDTGISAEQTLSTLLEHWNPRCSPPWQPEELRVKVRNAYHYAHNKAPKLETLPALFAESTVEGFESDPNEIGIHNWTSFLEYTRTFQGEKLIRDVTNCRLFLEFSQHLHGLWAFDQFEAAPIVTGYRNWMGETEVPLKGYKIDDALINKLRYFILTHHKENFSLTVLNETIDMLCARATFHPVRTYLENLRWDGIDRCHTWLSRYCAVEDAEYARAVGVRWLVGAVQRVMQPGSQMDSMLIFYGKQGLGKSTAANILAGDWFLDNLKPLGGFGKESEEGLRGKWIVEVAELQGFNRVDMTKIKEFLTRKVDTYRMSYGRRSADFPRQCVFIGTTNESHFLRDDENRRFWAVECKGDFDLAGLRRDRNQIWAQALTLYKQGHPSYLETKGLQLTAHEVSKRYTVTDPWRILVKEYLDGKNFDEKVYDEINPLKIYLEALGGTAKTATTFEMQKVQNALKFLGWEEVATDTWVRR